MFSRAIDKLNERRGDILTNVIAGIIILAAISAAMVMLASARRSQQNSSQMEAAGDAASIKLEALMNEPWGSADLTAGQHTDGSANAVYSWIVTDVTGHPRLKKIQVVKKHEQAVTRAIASQGILVTGYRYNDF